MQRPAPNALQTPTKIEPHVHAMLDQHAERQSRSSWAGLDPGTPKLWGMHLLDSTRAAPPMRKRQLGMSMERSSPKYQFCVMFSVLTTSAVELGYA